MLHKFELGCITMAISPVKAECDTSCKNRSTNTAGSKLARRARSFKDDFLDILAAMRSPPSSASSGSRSSSPKSRGRNRSKSPKQRLSSASDPYDFTPDNPSKDLEFHVKQVQFSLRHFQDVVSRNKLEVLPGNGTIVLETVANIHSILKPYTLDEQSSSVVSGLNQVYQSVAKLIKLCDDLLICGEKALDKEYVTEVVRLVEDGVQNLVLVTSDRLLDRDRGLQSSSSASSRCSTVSSNPSHYRVSLPDIPLTPHEIQILEQTSCSALGRNCSSPKIYDLSDMPPSKPPLPHRTFIDSPPPLPPKRRLMNNVNHANTTVPTSLSLERLSLKSDGSSITSLDSVSGSSRLDSSFIDDSSALTKIPESVSPSSTYNFSSLHASSSRQHSFSSTSTFVDGSHVITTTTHHQSTTSTKVTSLSSPKSEEEEVPPELPVKMRKNKALTNQNNSQSTDNATNGHNLDAESPPPLPPKKKHIMAYMEMFGNCSHGNTTEFLRHSVHTYSLLQAEWQQNQMTLSSTQSCSFNVISHSSSRNSLGNDEPVSTPPALPPRRTYCNTIKSSQSLPYTTSSPVLTCSTPQLVPPPVPPLPQRIIITEIGKLPSDTSSTEENTFKNHYLTNEQQSVSGNGETDINILNEVLSDPLAEIDVSNWLVFKKSDEDGPDVRGGHPDALIVLATKASKNDFLYQEAFLTTYRTFISPSQLLGKLIDRYQRFDTPSDVIRQRVARESFSLLVRVVGDLTFSDLVNNLIEMLMEFVYQLLCNGELMMGKALRVKLLEKYLLKLQRMSSIRGTLSSQNVYTRQSTLLDFKSEHIAEQMTLLDSELFMNIEIPEVLNWIQEQNEEKSPNLTLFTEHFNKMSYWARSRILEQSEAKDRERYVLKFIKIMKHLRKMNNFNSYLALLSALDSAPIRRLEWQKNITEGLKEYCALIDSSSSFRAYRQALAETQPPCIPYIGLVLQDLTFVHIGNNDYLSENVINFSKRWQQFNIVENMKRFKKVTYNFKTHERIVAFFSNFDEFLCEEAMWQISESIKPRGNRKKVNS